MTFDEWWNNWSVKDWNDIESAKNLFQQAFEAGLHADVHTDNSKVIADLEEKLANADYQLEGRDVKIKELEAEKDKAWWEGFDTCKAKAGEANVKLSEELETERKKNAELTEQIKEIENYFVESAGYGRDKVRNFMDIVNKALEQKGERITELEKENARLATNEKSLLAERKIIAKENTEAKNLIEELASSLSVVGECGEEECELINKAQKFINKPIF